MEPISKITNEKKDKALVVVFPQAPFRATNVPRPTLVSSNCATAPRLSEEGRR